MKKITIIYLVFLSTVINAQTLKGIYITQNQTGIGGDKKISEKAKIPKLYKYTYSKNKSNLIFYGKRGSIQIEFPEKIGRWFEDHSANLDVRSGAWPELVTTLQNWSELMNLSPEKIIAENWWKKWRGEVVWVIRK